MIDDRRNATMFGVTLCLLTITSTTLLYKIAVSLTITALYVALKKYNAFGEADLNGLTWILYGYGLLGVSNLIVFFVIFAMTTLFFTLLKRWPFKYKQPVPFFGIILLSYVSTNLLIGAYGGS